MTETPRTPCVPPDCRPEALAALQALAQPLLEHFKAQSEVPDEAPQPGPETLPCPALRESLTSISHVLQLIDRPAAVLLVEELRALLTAHEPDADSADTGSSAPTSTLQAGAGVAGLEASRQLIVYLEYLKSPGATDSAVLLADALNRCRACRLQPGLSDEYLMGRGIPQADDSGEPALALVSRFRQRLPSDGARLAQAREDFQRLRQSFPVFAPGPFSSGSMPAGESGSNRSHAGVLPRHDTASEPALLAAAHGRMVASEPMLRRILGSAGRIGMDADELASLQHCSRTLDALPLPEGRARLDELIEHLQRLPPSPEAGAHSAIVARVWVRIEQYLLALGRRQPGAGAILMAVDHDLASLRSDIPADGVQLSEPNANSQAPELSSDIAARLQHIDRQLTVLEALQDEPQGEKQHVARQNVLMRLAAGWNSIVESAQRTHCQPATALATQAMRLTCQMIGAHFQASGQLPGLMPLSLMQDAAALLVQVLGRHAERREIPDIQPLLGDLAAECEQQHADESTSVQKGSGVECSSPQVAGTSGLEPGPETAHPVIDDTPATDGQQIEAVFDREARELLSALRIDARDLRTDTDGKVLSRMMGGLHTLKGSARMAGHGELAERAHQLEQELQQAAPVSRALLADDGLAWLQQAMPAVHIGAFDRASRAIPAMTIDRVLSLTTQSTFAVARLGEYLTRSRKLLGELEVDTIRSPAAASQALSGASLAPQGNSTREAVPRSSMARLCELVEAAETEYQQASRAGMRLQQALLKGQLQRVDTLRSRLCTTLNDACRGLDKSASLSMVGGQLPIERELLAALVAPLEHLIRNAVAHGIEPAGQRLAVGKSADGQLQVRVQFDATVLVVSVHDDGAGIALQQIDQARARAGSGPVQSAEELCQCLCESGFSTLNEANQMAGRGLGLHAVHQWVDARGGQLSLTTRSGQGTRVHMRLPQAATLAELLMLRCGARLYGVPCGAIAGVTALTGRRPGSRMHWGDRQWQVRALCECLGENPGEWSPGVAGTHTLVMMELSGSRWAFQVDDCLGARELIVRPLGSQVGAMRRFCGGAVLPDGRQLLVLDMTRLFDPATPTSTDLVKSPLDT